MTTYRMTMTSQGDAIVWAHSPDRRRVYYPGPASAARLDLAADNLAQTGQADVERIIETNGDYYLQVRTP